MASIKVACYTRQQPSIFEGRHDYLRLVFLEYIRRYRLSITDDKFNNSRHLDQDTQVKTSLLDQFVHPLRPDNHITARTINLLRLYTDDLREGSVGTRRHLGLN